MKNKFLNRTLAIVLSLYTLLAAAGISASAESGVCVYPDECAPALSDNVKVSSRLYELFFGKGEKESKPTSLVVGGDVFGVKIKQKYVTVTEAKGVPALKAGDVILSVNGERVSTAADVKRLIAKSGGESVTIRALHAGSEVGVEIRPTLDGGEYKLGLSLRDGAAGLGTVTFIDKETGVFGGLGHGICDSESGEVILMESGEVCGVILGGVHKGECGKPGELCGILTDSDLGDLNINSECGVFGVITDPAMLSGSEREIAHKSEVKEGEATIISTIKNGKTAEYKIEIYDIDQSSNGSKSFRIRVTDETLKAISGGIVRGMSGSPIIQNGKLVGAVTHVMVADPTEGYGIFIENMLSAAGQIALPKAA